MTTKTQNKKEKKRSNWAVFPWKFDYGADLKPKVSFLFLSFSLV
ncbi:hypothetical protein WN944_026392 [Citrus x changshan-huyou]|uniref:Uncharacterized protein n=1 Tax=Citrus x changshan-huyou TaxID=2935761 RepID=A0AAP0LSF1_9ROSI